MRHLVSELGGAVIDGRPHAGEPWPDADATLILAGGEESAGVDLLVDSKPGGPRFLIGAAADHRIAAAALQNGAADYFALPADLDLLRRRLEREARRSEGRLEAERFAEGERQTSGFQTILGGSPALRQTLDQARRGRRSPRPHRADRRRDRDRQGAAGAGPPLRQPSSRGAVRRGELRGDSGQPARERAVRPRAGRLHRRRRGQAGTLRDGARRHALPGRDRAPCRSSCSPSCSAPWSRAPSGGSVASRVAPWTCG